MNDVESWIYFEGPEPEPLQSLLDAVRELPPATPEDKERVLRQIFERLKAASSRGQGAAGGEAGEESGTEGGADAPVAPVAPVVPVATPNAERRGGKDDVTARSVTFDDRHDALLFKAAVAPEARGERAKGNAGTAPMPDLPDEMWQKLGRLPFKPAPPGQAPTTTAQEPVAAKGRGETAPIGEKVFAKAVAAMPFASSTVGKAIVPFPELNLLQYASLRAELAMSPERASEILPRYHVPSEAVRRALEEYWAARLAANAEERAAFERAVREFSAYLWARKVQGG
jgi:hypothetical protein